MKTIHKARYQSLLKLLTDARKEAGLTQSELSAKLMRPQSYVSKIENAERRLDVIEFLELCEALEKAPNTLIEQI